MNRRHFLSVVAGAAIVPAAVPVQMPALSIGGGWYRNFGAGCTAMMHGTVSVGRIVIINTNADTVSMS